LWGAGNAPLKSMQELNTISRGVAFLSIFFFAFPAYSTVLHSYTITSLTFLIYPRQTSAIPLTYEEFWEPPNDDSSQEAADLKSKNGEGAVAPDEHTWLRKGAGTTINTNLDENSLVQIPRIINKVFIQKNGNFPDKAQLFKKVKENHHSWHEKNPEYEVRYYDLHRCRKYLGEYFHPAFLRAFDCIEAFAGKVNLFRFAVIYREGGWYSDWKQECLENNLLEELASKKSSDFPDVTLFLTKDEGNDHSVKHECMQNAFFGAAPRHPVIAKSLHLVLHHVSLSFHGETPLDNTGVCVFGEAYNGLKRDPTFSINPHTKVGLYKDLYFYFEKNKIVNHKCKSCGTGQDWGNSGNDYNALHEKREYYCQDASSVLIPSTFDFFLEEEKETQEEPCPFQLRNEYQTIQIITSMFLLLLCFLFLFMTKSFQRIYYTLLCRCKNNQKNQKQILPREGLHKMIRTNK